MRTDRLDVQCDVRSAAEPRFLARYAYHGYGGFGRDALYIAKQVAVEHCVANHQDTRAL
jgi:hypothetical protein